MEGALAALSLPDIREAAARLDGVAHRTPVLSSRTLDERLGCELLLKAECFQRGGAFKFRGAYNAVASLEPEVSSRGVCAVSSGNHAQAVTLAAGLCEKRAVILMPADASTLKREATEGYGAEVVTFDRYRDDREQLVRELAAERGLTLIHPFDDERVMAGQGTAALELLDFAGAGTHSAGPGTRSAGRGLDAVLVPVGGGGLIAGTATAVKAVSPSTRVIGVEPQASDDVVRSMASGRRERFPVGQTIADGQQTTSPGELTWPVIHRLVDEVVAVSDAQILDAMRLLFERMKLVVEPSGACALAALVAGVVRPPGRRVGVIISGGNIGAEAFAALFAG